MGNERIDNNIKTQKHIFFMILLGIQDDDDDALQRSIQWNIDCACLCGTFYFVMLVVVVVNGDAGHCRWSWMLNYIINRIHLAVENLLNTDMVIIHQFNYRISIPIILFRISVAFAFVFHISHSAVTMDFRDFQ